MENDIIRRIKRLVPGLAVVCAIACVSGCSIITGNITRDLATSLSDAIRDTGDPATVKQGSPAYLILIDALVRNSPSDPSLLNTAAMLHATYADVFVEDRERILALTDKALNYALSACCNQQPAWCGLDSMTQDDFTAAMAKTRKKDVSSLYTLGAVWATWITARSGDLQAFSKIPRIETVMNNVIELDETHMDGSAYLYLGTIATLLPPMLGGEPEKGRDYFERALELSGGRNLMIKVIYAKQYARMVYDRDLHDRLLNDVLSAPARMPGYTLVNTLAKEKARELLSSSGDYF